MKGDKANPSLEPTRSTRKPQGSGPSRDYTRPRVSTYPKEKIVRLFGPDGSFLQPRRGDIK